VSWDLIAGSGGFIETLNAVYPGMDFRLPTEAEWEYACRAGSTTAYYFGDDSGLLGDYAWYNGNSADKTHPVGGKLPNAFGLYDMSGNVWEWVQDWGGEYSADAVIDPAGPATGTKRVLRGGRWGRYGDGCRSADRGIAAPGDALDDYGARIVRTVIPTAALAAFSMDVTSGALPLTVSFTDMSSPNISPITSWFWDFGDGSTSTLQNPVHTYSETASLEATLTVTTGAGSDTESLTLYPGYGVTETFAGIEFILLPPGTFQMGQDSVATPVHEVTLTQGFWMSKYEVTQAQWQAVMESNPSHFTGDTNRPVENVSWNMTAGSGGFIETLNAANPGMDFRLPTEAEWEYACRAGSTTAYYFGNDSGLLGDYAWYDDNAVSTTHPVGGKLPNAFGLYDMSGNVWEWCQDWIGAYTAAAVTDPTGPTTGTQRVLRGGCRGHSDRYCRSAGRGANDPADASIGFGVRLVRTP
jgi:formylglycine-generating enzyme required for sulfatase activity